MTEITSVAHKEYIGDGVHASHDGFNIWLQTEREDGSVARIALEPEVFHALVGYQKRLVKAFKQALVDDAQENNHGY